MLSQGRLRKRAVELIKKLGLTGSFDAFEFAKRLQEKLGYEIKLQPLLMPPGLFGLWSLIKNCHVILYRANTSWLHQQQIILHECGHICLGHHPGDIKKFLKREAVYSNPQEEEAETFATLLLEKAITQSFGESGIFLEQSSDMLNFGGYPEDVKSMQEFLDSLKELN